MLEANIPLDKDCSDLPFSKPKRRRVGFGMFTDIPNPIPAEIVDPKEIEDTFKHYGFIPYAATDHNSNHSLLLWLNSMSHLSPTHGSCINSIKSYALGQPLDIIKRHSQAFGIDTKLTEKEKETFVDWLDSTFRFQYNSNLHKIALNSYKNNKDNGNYFLEVVLSKFAGQEAANIIVHNTETVCYVTTKPNKTRFAGISHRWDIGHIKNNPPKVLPVYPAFKVLDEGATITTLIHIKEDTTKLYGRPEWLNSFMSVYREYQDANYLIKQAAANFMAQSLIEVEDSEGGTESVFSDADAQKDGFANASEQFSKNFTAESDDPQSVILLSRPYGAKEAFVFQFKPNTSEQFYKVMSELQELDIIRAHQWSKRFLGENQTQGFSKDVFLDELKVKEACMLPALRHQACLGINLALNMMSIFFNRPEFSKYMVTGRSNIDLLKSMLPEGELTEGLVTENLPKTDE